MRRTRRAEDSTKRARDILVAPPNVSKTLLVKKILGQRQGNCLLAHVDFIGVVRFSVFFGVVASLGVYIRFCVTKRKTSDGRNLGVSYLRNEGVTRGRQLAKLN